MGADFFELMSEANLLSKLNDEIPHVVSNDRNCFCRISDYFCHLLWMHVSVIAYGFETIRDDSLVRA